jgi:hypothetical protein
MVSEKYTALSLMVPVTMVIGTSITILMYRQSYNYMIFMCYFFGFLLVCIFGYMAFIPPRKK